MLRILPLMLLLTACNTPSQAFRDVPVSTVTIDGSTFDVRIKDRRAEALRTNVQYAPRMGPIGGRAAMAIEQVSGCLVHDISGDQAVVQARLDCGDGVPAKKRGAVNYECRRVEGLPDKKTKTPNYILNCDPVPKHF